MTISVVINGDNRHGYLADQSQVGDFGSGSLQGVRSKDLLTDGLRNKLKFFEGYNIQCIFYLDIHEPLPPELHEEIKDIVLSCGNDSKLILNPHSKARYKWNDWLYIEALKEADGDYIVHMDNDTCAYKREGFDVIGMQLKLLEQYKFVCQSWDGVGDEMYWASTRYFICKREALNFPEIEKALYQHEVNGMRNPCLEFLISALNGRSVLYPKRQDDDYIIFCWAKYFSGIQKHLNEKPYDYVINYLKDCGLYGTHDIIAKPITNE